MERESKGSGGACDLLRDKRELERGVTIIYYYFSSAKKTNLEFLGHAT